MDQGEERPVNACFVCILFLFLSISLFILLHVDSLRGTQLLMMNHDLHDDVCIPPFVEPPY